MRWHTSSASSSSAGIADDIRLIPPNEQSPLQEESKQRYEELARYWLELAEQRQRSA